jgi:hypothetical protein
VLLGDLEVGGRGAGLEARVSVFVRARVVAKEGNESKHGDDDPLDALNVVGTSLPEDENPQKAGVIGGKEPGKCSDSLDKARYQHVHSVRETPVGIDVRVDSALREGSIVKNVHHPVVHVEFLQPVHGAQNCHGTSNSVGGQLLFTNSGNCGVFISFSGGANSLKNVCV